MAFSVIDGKDLGDIKLFTISTCAWCDKMKTLLSENGIKFQYMDMDLVDEEELTKTSAFLDSIYPKWGFPSMLFDNRVLIVGYQESEIRQTLGLGEAAPNALKNGQISIGEDVQKVMNRLQRFSERKGASLNPDQSITAKLVGGLLHNQDRYGYWACPCRLASGEKGEDRDIICPCDYWEQDVLEFGACFCGLFVSQGVAKGEAKIKTVPERRVKKSS